MSLTGIVHKGVIILDEPSILPEGTRVEVVVATDSPPLGQRLMNLAGIAKDLPPYMAEQHDHYLHGTPKK